MGRVRVTRPTRAILGFALGVLAVAAGLFLTLGLGWALVAAGGTVAAGSLLLYDVDESEPTGIRHRVGDGW